MCVPRMHNGREENYFSPDGLLKTLLYIPVCVYSADVWRRRRILTLDWGKANFRLLGKDTYVRLHHFDQQEFTFYYQYQWNGINFLNRCSLTTSPLALVKMMINLQQQ